MSTKCCVLEQDTLSKLLSTGVYPGRPAAHNTQKISHTSVMITCSCKIIINNVITLNFGTDRSE